MLVLVVFSGCVDNTTKEETIDEEVLIGDWVLIEGNDNSNLPSQNTEEQMSLSLNSDKSGNLGGYEINWNLQGSKLIIDLYGGEETKIFDISYLESTGRLKLIDEEKNEYIFEGQQ